MNNKFEATQYEKQLAHPLIFHIVINSMQGYSDMATGALENT